MKLKAIAMDLDGTLLNEQNRISDKTRETLKDLQKQGTTLILASGRSWKRQLPYAKELGMDENNGKLIETDGIALWDFAKDKRVKFTEMDPETIIPVMEWLTKQNAESQAVFDDGMFVYYPKHLQPLKEKFKEENHLSDDYPWTAGPWGWLFDMRDGYPDIHYIENANEIDRPVNKIQIMHEEEVLLELYERLMKEFGDKFTIYRTTPRQLEILPKGFSKGYALQQIMLENGWKPEEVAAFGDGENDVEMFSVCDHSFAMDNARDYVKEKAKHTAGSNREDGIVSGLQAIGVLQL
jgi:hypothetical protein